MDAGCSALLAIGPGCAARVSSPVSLLALPPSCAARPLARSLVPSARTACRNSAINARRGRYVCRSFRCTCHEEHRARTFSCYGLGFCASTATAARNRRSSGELDSSPCAFSHTASALMEAKGSAGCSTLRAGALASPREGRKNARMPNNLRSAGALSDKTKV